jgi:hypothetical protein
MEKYSSNDFKALTNGWVKFSMEKSLHPTLISFMDELDDLFLLELPT